MTTVRLAIASDLHYAEFSAGANCRPATAQAGPAGDPMQALLRRIAEEASATGTRELRADYLLCPGDITSKASAIGFEHGWAELKRLQVALGARDLFCVTGNHEVNSRAGERSDVAGYSEESLDPLAAPQRHEDYPSTALNDQERWVYWGRGYHVVERGDVVFLLINSSHFHPTTRPLEFERGRIGDIAIERLRRDLSEVVGRGKNRAFIALLHHHPIPFQPLGGEENRIEMHNGPQLMELLQGTDVTWLVVHGHKHMGRLIRAQGGSLVAPVVFSAGSFGAFLEGSAATNTKLQFYILEVDILDQAVQPSARGHVRALSWSGTAWDWAKSIQQGLPDRCGFVTPTTDTNGVARQLHTALSADSSPFKNWAEAQALVPELRYLFPDDAKFLRGILGANHVKTVWPDTQWFPDEVAK